VFSKWSVRRYKQDSESVSQLNGWRVSELDKRWGSAVVSCCCAKLVAEAGDSSGPQRKGNVRRGKPLPSNG
jgi:hypothetical protein